MICSRRFPKLVGQEDVTLKLQVLHFAGVAVAQLIRHWIARGRAQRALPPSPRVIYGPVKPYSLTAILAKRIDAKQNDESVQREPHGNDDERGSHAAPAEL